MSNPLDKIEDQMKKLELEKEKLKQQAEAVAKKINIPPSKSMIASFIETFAILFFGYLVPIILLFIDRKFSITFGLSFCQTMEGNFDAVIYLYTVLQGMFVLKTFSKKQEKNAKEVVNRSNFGKTLTWISGVFLLASYLIISPILNNWIPYYATYLGSITWESVFLLTTIGGLYIGNKLIFATNKKELMDALKESSPTEEPIE